MANARAATPESTEPQARDARAHDKLRAVGALLTVVAGRIALLQSAIAEAKCEEASASLRHELAQSENDWRCLASAHAFVRRAAGVRSRE